MVTEVDGRPVSLRSEPGAAPTLVFLHGAADNRHGFDRLLDALSGMARIAVDRPGRLGSEGTPLATVGEAAEFMRSLLSSEVDGPFVLVGHSLGGAVALELALSSPPPDLTGIVLISTGARLRVHPSILASFEERAAADAGSHAIPGLCSVHADPSVLGQIDENLEKTPATTGLVDWMAADRFDRVADVATISVPTLILSGSEDTLTPFKYAEYLHTRVPNSTLRILEGCGHTPQLEDTPEAARAIREFVESV